MRGKKATQSKAARRRRITFLQMRPGKTASLVGGKRRPKAGADESTDRGVTTHLYAATTSQSGLETSTAGPVSPLSFGEQLCGQRARRAKSRWATGARRKSVDVSARKFCVTARRRAVRRRRADATTGKFQLHFSTPAAFSTGATMIRITAHPTAHDLPTPHETGGDGGGRCEERRTWL